MAHGLSRSAELLLLAIDPADGGLFACRRRRLRRALGGMRGARKELEGAGLADGMRLLDRAVAAERFRQVRRCVVEGDCAGERERELAVLLGWSGVLAARLSKNEQKRARRRLKQLVYEVPLPEEDNRDLLLRITSDFEDGDVGGLASAADFRGPDPPAGPSSAGSSTEVRHYRTRKYGDLADARASATA